MIETERLQKDRFQRTTLLLGEEGVNKLENSHIMVCGLGGVGSYIVEALIRNSIGTITLVDFDKVDITNINRQILATEETIGKLKTDVIKRRIKSINPSCQVFSKNMRLNKENIEELVLSSHYDYIIDAVDTVEAKIALAKYTAKYNIPFISSMGFANKIHPEKIHISHLDKTHTCPLARVLRRELRESGVNPLVCFSDEKPLKTPKDRNEPLGTVSFVPSTAGLFIAGAVIREISNIEA